MRGRCVLSGRLKAQTWSREPSPEASRAGAGGQTGTVASTWVLGALCPVARWVSPGSGDLRGLGQQTHSFL